MHIFRAGHLFEISYKFYSPTSSNSPARQGRMLTTFVIHCITLDLVFGSTPSLDFGFRKDYTRSILQLLSLCVNYEYLSSFTKQEVVLVCDLRGRSCILAK
jgi:hypothetical protein